MVTAAVAVVSTAVAVKGQRDAKKAQQNAANQQRAGALESARLLDAAGQAGEADIIRQNLLAREASNQAAEGAAEPLAPFADLTAYKQAIDDVVGGLPVGGAIADSIRNASIDFIRNRPEFDLSGAVGREVDRQGDIAVSGATPVFTDSLMSAGQQGLAASSDIAQIKQRGLNRLGDIAGAEGSARANIVIGQGPQLTQLASGAQEARLLGDVAGQQFRTNATESVAGLAGQLFAPNVGLLRQQPKKDEFGFTQGEDPFA